MGLLKEKSSYRPTRFEIATAWIVTGVASLAVAWFVVAEFLRLLRAE